MHYYIVFNVTDSRNCQSTASIYISECKGFNHVTLLDYAKPIKPSTVVCLKSISRCCFTIFAANEFLYGLWLKRF